ncbi:MAG: orotate phosphoribosyltransferase [Clostridia bacterium]|nr:orotate phosphoribosyltransferase [Clostridia bacterium]MBQ7037880.1 orotate phosphoribosyltransferase [Clostridia bacterium]
MPTLHTMKYATKRNNLFLRVAMGHFATGNCHSNYYIDVVAQKARMSEARAVAEELSSYYYADTVVDTILCLDGTEVIGACLADCLSKADIINMNAHKSIYVVTPETVNGSQLMFRDNIVPMIAGKHVMILAVSVASGKTVEAAIDAVQYYGGTVSGVSAIFSTAKECGGLPVHSVFDPNDLPDYQCHPSHECPMCKAGKKVDALVNCHGFSKL